MTSQLQRRAPMPRGQGFKPAEPKPAAGPKKKSCRVCRTKFVPSSPLAAVCGVPCAIEHARTVAAKQKAKERSAERAADKVKRERLKTRGDHIADVQKVFNELVRFRDRGEVCISCDTVLSTLSDKIGGGYDCGHYRSRGSAPHLRFDLRNAHGQCKKCNRYRSGNAADYRIGLIVRIGLAAVEALEAEQGGGGWTIPELLAMKADFRAQLKKMKEAA
jgi:hypothetical protein